MSTIRRGLRELDRGTPLRATRQREAGAGRPAREVEDPKLLRDLDALVDPVTRGDPSSPLRWTCKSTRQLAEELRTRGHAVSHQTVGRLLHQLDFSLQADRKTNLAVGKAIPYGVYDLAQNEGWVSIGTDHDTSAFAVASIRQWWARMGRITYPTATELLITADSGGSNSARARQWKVELQRLADQTGLHITVCHFPPGTSKWNKIEHRMFCHITTNWRGRPLVAYQVVVSLIAHTTTTNGLKIYARLDHRHYQKGVKVTNTELAAVNLTQEKFHVEWNYTIAPTCVRD